MFGRYLCPSCSLSRKAPEVSDDFITRLDLGNDIQGIFGEREEMTTTGALGNTVLFSPTLKLQCKGHNQGSCGRSGALVRIGVLSSYA